MLDDDDADDEAVIPTPRTAAAALEKDQARWVTVVRATRVKRRAYLHRSNEELRRIVNVQDHRLRLLRGSRPLVDALHDATHPSHAMRHTRSAPLLPAPPTASAPPAPYALPAHHKPTLAHSLSRLGPGASQSTATLPAVEGAKREGATQPTVTAPQHSRSLAAGDKGVAAFERRLTALQVGEDAATGGEEIADGSLAAPYDRPLIVPYLGPTSTPAPISFSNRLVLRHFASGHYLAIRPEGFTAELIPQCLQASLLRVRDLRNAGNGSALLVGAEFWFALPSVVLPAALSEHLLGSRLVDWRERTQMMHRTERRRGASQGGGDDEKHRRVAYPTLLPAGVVEPATSARARPAAQLPPSKLKYEVTERLPDDYVRALIWGSFKVQQSPVPLSQLNAAWATTQGKLNSKLATTRVCGGIPYVLMQNDRVLAPVPGEPHRLAFHEPSPALSERVAALWVLQPLEDTRRDYHRSEELERSSRMARAVHHLREVRTRAQEAQLMPYRIYGDRQIKCQELDRVAVSRERDKEQHMEQYIAQRAPMVLARDHYFVR